MGVRADAAQRTAVFVATASQTQCVSDGFVPGARVRLLAVGRHIFSAFWSRLLLETHELIFNAPRLG